MVWKGISHIVIISSTVGCIEWEPNELNFIYVKLYYHMGCLMKYKATREVKNVHIFSYKKEEADTDLTNRDLIEQIILEQYNQYYRLAYSYVHNEADAFDIVQNGVYKALRGSRTLKKTAYAQTWVYRIMLNECFRQLKQPRNFSYEMMQGELGMELSCTEENCDRIDLERALDSLAKKDKAVVLLRYFEDKKLEEIAEILNENVSTVKSRLYRSMKKLRRVLGDG